MVEVLDFFAEVEILDHAESEVANTVNKGVVLGRSQDEDTDEWFYAVMIFEQKECVMFPGTKLRATGAVIPREMIYGGDCQTVIVDPKTGRGNFAG